MSESVKPKLTDRQAEVLEMIRNWIIKHGYPPTRRDIAEHFDFKSPNASEEHLKALERKQAIEIFRNTSRGIVLAPEYDPRYAHDESWSHIPVVGRVAAGSPMLAEEHIERHVDISNEIFSPKADYFLRVQGDSMVGAGILDQDLLAVHKTVEVRNGQIVVARIDEDVTVKRFERLRTGSIVLHPANPHYERILVERDHTNFNVEGISVGLVRDH